MPGRSFFTLGCTYNGTSSGAEAFFGQYTLTGYWEAGVMADDYHATLSTGQRLQYDHLAAAGDFMFRLAATRSRSVNLYAGAGVFAGVEMVDPFHRLPTYLDLPVASKSFLYGLYAKALAEFYLGRRFAFTVEGCVPMTFPGHLGWLRWKAGIGLKIII